MTEHVAQTIGMVQQQIASLESELVEKKRMVNSLCTLINRAPIYNDAALVVTSGIGPTRSDEYYGQPLATAIRMVLERRQLAKLGPAPVNEIYDALVAGGYKFEAKTEDYAKRGLYSALTKNTATFHKLPGGSYGLLEWYPGVKEPKPAKGMKLTTDATAIRVELPSDEDIIDAPCTSDEEVEVIGAVEVAGPESKRKPK